MFGCACISKTIRTRSYIRIDSFGERESGIKSLEINMCRLHLSANITLILLLLTCPLLAQTHADGKGAKPQTPPQSVRPAVDKVAPANLQDHWVSIFPVGIRDFGLWRDTGDPNTLYVA